jgi:hypothetical protein
MAAMELGESSDDDRLAIGVTMSSPTAAEVPPRIIAPAAMREMTREAR